MAIATALAFLLLQAPQATPPAPPNPAPSRLIDRPQLRPSRADNARENLARDPNEPRQPAEQPEPEAAIEPEPPAPTPAPAPPPPTPAPGLAPMAPSAVMPGAAASSSTSGAPATAPAAKPAAGAAAWVQLLPIGAPLAMLVGPAIGLLWLAARRSAVQ